MKIINIPNIITSMNLLCGVLGVIFTLEGRIDIGFYLMLAGAICDFLDGFAARLLSGYSEIGKQLDSLADIVSFGVLPSIMLYKIMLILGVEPSFLAYAPLVLAVFSALRLAKFNVDTRQSDNFIGLPSPASAMIAGSLAYYAFFVAEGFLIDWCKSPIFIPTLSIILSLLLISEIPMFSMKIKKKGDRKDKDKFYNAKILFIVFFLSSFFVVLRFSPNWSLIILITFVSYILINIITAIIHKKL